MIWHLANARAGLQHETFYSSSVYTNKLTDDQIKSFVSYWYGIGKTVKRDWYAQMDIHGGKNNAISAQPKNSTAYAHRDFLLMTNFYDRVDQGTYPADGFSFLQAFVANMTHSLDKEEWGQYINYPDPKLNQSTAQVNYWAGHLSKLQELKQDLDPPQPVSLSAGRAAH